MSSVPAPPGAPMLIDRRAPATRAQVFARHRVFAIVAVLAFASPALPHRADPDLRWWLAAWVLLLLSLTISAISVRASRVASAAERPPLSTLGPMLSFPAIHAVRCADGNSVSGFGILVLLPVIWFALYGLMRQVVAAVIGAAATLTLPLLIVGSPQYPAFGLRGALLIIVISAALGPTVNRLVVGSRTVSSNLIRREADFRAAFENAPIGMAIIGASGARVGYFLRVNRAMTEMFGRSARELTSVPLTSFAHPDERQPFSAADLDASRDGGRSERRFVHGSGRTFWASVSSSVVRDDDGRPLHIVSQIEDVSARRESDQALLEALESDRTASEQRRMLDRARAEMAAAVSHELRTPLTSAQGYVELVLEGDPGALNAEQRSMLDTAYRSLNRLNATVEDILSVASRSDAELGRPVVVELGALVDQAVAGISLQIAGRGQDFRVHNALDGVRVVGDPGRLERVLLNLLTNAMKFTPDDGTISLRAGVEDGNAVIAISDTGIGIAAADLARIFQRFYRSDAQGVGTVVPGTGLGLAIAQTITAQYGGRVDVDSEPGRGSTFTVTLPALDRAG